MIETTIGRRRAILGAGSAIMTIRPGSLSAQLNAWSPVAPAHAGFDPDLGARLDKANSDKRVWNLHGLVVLRNDRLVLDTSTARILRAASGRLGASRSSPTRDCQSARTYSTPEHTRSALVLKKHRWFALWHRYELSEQKV